LARLGAVPHDRGDLVLRSMHGLSYQVRRCVAIHGLGGWGGMPQGGRTWGGGGG
jgi:hypothetical protein